MALKLSLSVPTADILAYRKLGKAYFALLDVLCQSHPSVIATCDTATFAFLVRAPLRRRRRGGPCRLRLPSSGVPHCSVSCGAGSLPSEPAKGAGWEGIAVAAPNCTSLLPTLARKASVS